MKNIPNFEVKQQNNPSDWYFNYFTYFLSDLAWGLYEGFLQVLQPLAANLQRPHPNFWSDPGWASSAGGTDSCDARGLRFLGNAFIGLALDFGDFMAFIAFLLGVALGSLGFDFRGRPLLPEVDARLEVLICAWSWGVTSASWPWPANLKGKESYLNAIKVVEGIQTYNFESSFLRSTIWFF